VTGPDGTLQYAPHNLQLQSEGFAAAAVWAPNAAAITANTTTSPTNSLTADTLTEDTASNAHGVLDLATSVTSGVTYTFSVYVKSGTASVVQLLGRTGSFGTDVWANFNLATGAVSAVGTSTSASITNAGNGWYRCAITGSAVASTVGGAAIALTNNDPTAARFPSYVGTGKSVIIWGAQLNVGSLQLYYPSTVKNLLGFSQEFDNAAWTANSLNVSVFANSTVAPDGSATADKIIATAALGAHFTRQFSSVTSGVTYTQSLYTKASEYSVVQITSSTGFDGSGTTFRNFLLSTGSLGNGTLSGSIESVGDGWYRVSVSATATSTQAVGRFNINVLPSDQNTANFNYTGDGTSGIYIWGAQLSDSASLDPYVYNPGAAPTAAAYYGPRFDYDPVTLQPKGLLIEEQRTNSIRNNTMQGAVVGVIGSGGAAPTNWSGWSAGAGGLNFEIVGTGLSAGVNYVDIRLYGTATTTNISPGFEAFTQIAAANGQTWANSFYMQIVENPYPITSFISRIRVSTAAGAAITSLDTIFTPSSSFTRFTSVGVISSTDAAFVAPQIRFGLTVGQYYDITLRIGLPQLELGAFATSVIPTTTAAATRAADVAVMTGANFSNWYNQSEGTLFVDALTPPNLAAFPTIVAISDGSTNNQATHYAHTSGYYSNVRSGGVVQGDPGRVASPVAGTPYKFAVGLTVDNAIGAANGTTGNPDTSLLMPVGVNQMRIGTNATGGAISNTHIRRIGFFPKRLSNIELQRLTS
jgi:hypothetical protein